MGNPIKTRTRENPLPAKKAKKVGKKLPRNKITMEIVGETTAEVMEMECVIGAVLSSSAESAREIS